jgi:hypothetical protein
MGRTLPSATIVFQQEEAAFSRFRRALRRSDQLALDDLFTSAHQHLAAAQYAAHALPFEVFLLSMLLEEHKEVLRMRAQIEAILAREQQACQENPSDAPEDKSCPGPQTQPSEDR